MRNTNFRAPDDWPQLSLSDVALEARTIRDSKGTVHGMRDKPLASPFKMLCARYGIENWREELRRYA